LITLPVESPPIVELRDVSKRYGRVRALSGVSLSVRPGSVHALVGENGAGKSTAGKVIAGVVSPSAGTVAVGGEPVAFRGPHEALAAGIASIAQELALVPRRSVLENVFLGMEERRRGRVSTGSQRERYRELEDLTEFGLDPDALVAGLPVADRQKVEIMHGMARGAQVLILDEPTARLTTREAEALREVVLTLASRGTAVIYISHFLQEVLAIADTVTVLKDGELVQSTAASEQTPDALIGAMLGRSLDAAFPDSQPSAEQAPVVCSLHGLNRGEAVRDVSLEVRAGEIVAFAGLIGSGRSELAHAIFGADRPDAGTVRLGADELRPRRPDQMIEAGVALVPESRADQGLVPNLSIAENITLPHLRSLSRAGIVSRRKERARVRELLAQVGVDADPDAPVSSLSGGNQQKVLFAKWLFRDPRLLIADEPTRGVDVAAKRAIYDLIVGLAAGGVAVLLISSEIEEVLGLAHRVLVMRSGAVVGEIERQDATEDAVMRVAFATAGQPEGD
jgi:ABC-type sugar transport system ATPase subunit